MLTTVMGTLCHGAPCQQADTTGPDESAWPITPAHNGREGEIRTPDPLLPKQVRYQAAPLPELFSSRESLLPCSAC